MLLQDIKDLKERMRTVEDRLLVLEQREKSDNPYQKIQDVENFLNSRIEQLKTTIFDMQDAMNARISTVIRVKRKETQKEGLQLADISPHELAKILGMSDEDRKNYLMKYDDIKPYLNIENDTSSSSTQ